MERSRNMAFGASILAHVGIIAALVIIIDAPTSGAMAPAPPTVELMLPPAPALAASAPPVMEEIPVDETKPIEPIEPVEAVEPEPVPTILPVMAEAVEAAAPEVVVTREPEPEKPKPPKPKPRTERPKKPAPPREEASQPPPSPAPPSDAPVRPQPSAITAGIAAPISGGGNPGARADYRALVGAWVEKHKRYPSHAQRRGLEGLPVVRFRIGRSGKVLFARLEQSSGRDALDEAALDTIARADPFPAMPDDVPGETMEFTVPIRFNIKR